jgi:hypothetical protein
MTFNIIRGVIKGNDQSDHQSGALHNKTGQVKSEKSQLSQQIQNIIASDAVVSNIFKKSSLSGTFSNEKNLDSYEKAKRLSEELGESIRSNLSELGELLHGQLLGHSL